jgi:predicted ATPase
MVHSHIARRAIPPAERLNDVPDAVSEIIMKLLAKTAEERYQTAAGLKNDLEHCLAEWRAQGRIDGFTPGEADQPDRLLIPERLYGREHEIEVLLGSFDRVARSGTPELVLISGHAGIGKSAVVHELHRALVPLGGLFASGKFDQYKRDIPYATLAQAFQNIVRRLLAKNDAELASWRDTICEALTPNGQLMVDLVPELKLVIGDQPPVPDASSQDALRRFQLVLQRFIGVFAQSDRPLVLFLDDLQWLDAATLDQLEELLTRSDLQHLLLIGAYRSNEIDANHPLRRKLVAIHDSGALVQTLSLAPLIHADVEHFIVDALRSEPARAAPLAQLIHEKTGGNPFFLIQFLHALSEEGLLAFDHETGQWRWDLERIHAKGYTENVVDLMVRKLSRLPEETRTALQTLACLGSNAEIATLSLMLGRSEQQVHLDLIDAMRLELVERLDRHCRFVHDRVQEAAYALIPESERPASHLRIGRLLVARTPPERDGDLRYRQSAQPRPIPRRLAGRARATRRAQLDCRPARQGILGL